MIISPKVGFWLSVILCIGGAFVGLGTQFAALGLSPAEVTAIQATDTIILTVGNALNAALHLIPASVPTTPAAAAQFALGPAAVPK